MAVTDNQPRISQWVIADECAAVENVFQLADQLSDYSPPLENLTVTLNNSPSGIQINGPVAQVRSEYESAGNPSFNNAQIVGSADGGKVSISIVLGHRHLTLNLQPAAAAHADAIAELVEPLFPRAEGPNLSRLENRRQRLEELLTQATEAAAAAERVGTAATESEEDSAKARRSAKEAFDAAVSGKEAADQAAKRDTEVSNLVAKIQQHLAEAQASRDSAKEASDEAGPPLEKVRAFAEEVDQERAKLTELFTTSTESLKDAEKRSAEILKTHTELQKEIAAHLQKAVGAGLFGAFNQRKSQLVRSKWIWAAAASAFGLVQVGVIWWVANYLKNTPPEQFTFEAFGLRIAASLPVLGLLLWCVRQYGHERHFEEVYAFKAALSFSLKPYLDLVQSLPGVDDSKHQEFITNSIRQVFEYPAERMGEEEAARPRGRRGRKWVHESVLKDLASIMRNIQH